MILDEQRPPSRRHEDAQPARDTPPSGSPPSWRKPVGVLAMLALVTVWLWAVVSLAGPVLELAWPLQTIFFLTMGVVWIAPLKPLLRWMEVGKWRE